MKVFLLAMSLFLCSITQAATYYISPTGNDATGTGTLANPWKTLFKATSTVTASGNIIHVLAGTYTETQQSDLAVGVSIEGDDFNTTIILSNLTGQWSNLLNLNSNQDTNGNQSISNVTLNGQYVSESNYKTWIAIWITGRSNVLIHDCKIINFKDRGVIYDGNNATDPITDPGHYATGNKFYNNTVLNCATNVGNYGAGCVNIGGQQGMEIYNNTIIQDQRANFKNGWPLKYWDNGWLKGVKVYNNTLVKAPYVGSYPGENGDWDFAIEFFNIAGLEIYNNSIQGSIDLNYNYKGAYAFCAWIHHNTLNHATINSNFESGIILEFATQAILIENNILNNVSSGVQFNTRGPGNNGGYGYPAPTGGFSALTDNIIRNNLISNVYQGNGTGTAGGILVISEGTDDPYIRNLTIYNNTVVAKAGDAPWIGLDFTSQPNGSCDGLYIRNNIVQGFQDAWLKGSNGATNIVNAIVTHNDAFGNGSGNTPNWPAGNPGTYTYNNNIAVNPLFVGSGYYTLQATSPCIDAGVNIGLPYSGSAPDMGYAEYASAGNIPPTANAGPDQTITLPTNSVTLAGSGTDPDGTVTAYLWTKVSGPAAGTITSPATAGTTVTGLVAGIYKFELRVTDNAGAFGRDTIQVTVNASSNIPPTANAGPDQTITLPTNSVTLAGSGTDPDGSVTAYLWTKISGPAAGTITSPATAGTTVTGLVAGVYKFELRVTDNAGAFGRDTMQVTVNAASNIPPAANAGPDQIITLPTNTVILSGSGTDPDGTVVAYLWTKVAGPATGTITNPTTPATSVTGLVQGVYRFELRVTDNAGAFGKDTVQITVNAASNIPPTANAGPDQFITLPTNSVTLSGIGTDPDGTVTGYLWTKISGPAAGTITTPNAAISTVTGLVQGTYLFELRVTDNAGAIDRDTMLVSVSSASNIPPVANAGADQTITLPVNSVALFGNGVDPDGTITGYLWTKVSGPAAGTITTPGAASTNVTGLVQGVYRFELRVTDNGGASGRDTVQITVNAGAPNNPPTANAGPDQTITLPTNSVILSGSGADTDGSIVGYQWTKISGPAAGTITNPTTAATSVTGLAQGVYQFELRVTDNGGAFGRDTVQVTVNPAASNIPPVANAGPDQTITLPTTSVILSGSGTDADGVVVSYLWTKISGPAAGTITNPNVAATSVTGLVVGTYRFELRVTDNGGAFGRDTIQVTVNAGATNTPPTANAGPDQTISLPTNAAILSGSGTDPDGTVTAYLWTKISGPAAGTITNPNVAATGVTGLVAGTYKFELRVTDNAGAFGRDTMQVTVTTTANIPPVANAGPNQTITLPVNSVILSGSGTDADGTVTAYLWTKISGPGSGTITNPNVAATSVTGLVVGTYLFELRVTDNNGAFGRDTMQVTVNAGATNTPPTANAGPNQTIVLPVNTVILSGSGIDPDGTITAYLWTQVSGPAASTIANANTAATSVTGLVQGVYLFELRVTDNSGAFGRDTVQVTVNPTAANIPPTANAGPDQSITLPVNATILSGSGTDLDGTVTAYLWTKISGPAAGTISNPATSATSVTGLVQGSYQFELRVTDNNGAFGRDTMIVVVNAANIPPVATAGPDQIITLPTNNTSLSGGGTDADGSIVKYEWRQLSGPSNNVLFTTNTATTFLNNLVEGIYVFELTVTDNAGGTGRDVVTVSVNATPATAVRDNDFKIYPNPVMNIATLDVTKINANSKPSVAVSDVNGKIVYTLELTSTQQVFAEKIDLSNLAKGPYVVVMYFPNGDKKAIKIIKQ